MLLLFAATLFVSAGLLFVLEPLAGRAVLPRLGGSPAVWNSCVVFFQVALLAGYGYAHASCTWLGARRQAILHLAILAGCLAFLAGSPLLLRGSLLAGPGGNPVPGLLACLGASYGVPLFAVCASAPLLQKWLSDTDHPSAADPYFLYGASNLGSMLALLAYPTLIEPNLTLHQQRLGWLAGSAALVLLCAGCACSLWRSGSAPATRPRAGQHWDGAVTWRRRLRWVALSFVPSSLMLGVTTYITTDIAAIPFLWVLPLALYLLTFILAFARIPTAIHSAVVLLMPLLVLLLFFLILANLQVHIASIGIFIHLAILFVAAMMCHGELARDRPDTEELTGYYLCISVGGVAGGLFNALLAPAVFPAVIEYPLALVLACLLLPPLGLARLIPGGSKGDAALAVLFAVVGVLLAALGLHELLHSRDAEQALGHLADAAGWAGLGLVLVTALGAWKAFRSPTERADAWFDLLLPLGLGLLTVGLIWGVPSDAFAPYLRKAADYLRLGAVAKLQIMLAYGLPAIICYTLAQRPLRFGLGVALFMLAATFARHLYDDALWQKRTFFGVLRVEEEVQKWAGQDLVMRRLVHGTTLHGAQLVDPRLHHIPLSYYHRSGPVGHLFAACNSDARRPLGVIGLGAGSLACYAEPGQQMTFYEIDPAIVDLTFGDNAYFSFVGDARRRGAHIDLVLGDARVEMTRQRLGPEQRYGILVVDAFSSDAIPVHLITREALEVYLDHLADDGILAFHISNRHVNLEPVLANLAEDLGLAALIERDYDDKSWPGKKASLWVVMARKSRDLERLLTPRRWDVVRSDLQDAFVFLSTLPSKGPGISSHSLMLATAIQGVYAPWEELQPDPTSRVGVWTDDYSNVLGVFEW
jgi:spermidine synthase